LISCSLRTETLTTSYLSLPGSTTGHQWLSSDSRFTFIGLRPYMMREEQWRFFRLRQSFRLLPEGARYSFEQEPPARAGRSYID